LINFSQLFVKTLPPFCKYFVNILDFVLLEIW